MTTPFFLILCRRTEICKWPSLFTSGCLSSQQRGDKGVFQTSLLQWCMISKASSLPRFRCSRKMIKWKIKLYKKWFVSFHVTCRYYLHIPMHGYKETCIAVRNTRCPLNRCTNWTTDIRVSPCSFQTRSRQELCFLHKNEKRFPYNFWQYGIHIA